MDELATVDDHNETLRTMLADYGIQVLRLTAHIRALGRLIEQHQETVRDQQDTIEKLRSEIARLAEPPA